MTDSEPMLTEREVAERLNVTRKFLQARRLNGGGPPFYKVGGAVRYRWSEVLAWIGPPKAGKGGGDETQ